jgi:vacuole morphology and inheritance protein 14
MDLMKIMQDLSPELLTSQEETTKKRHLESILDVVTAQLQSGKTESKVGSLTWITLLYTIVKPRMISYIDKIFPVLLKTLSDSNDEVVILDLRVLAVICEEGPPKNQHFKPFMNSLFRLFSADRNLLKKKGSYIIRQLSVSLNAEDIYR